MLAVSELVAPGEDAILFVLLPDATSNLELKPVAIWMNPPTAAAFDKPRRIDVLTIGETLDETGELAASVRLVVHNFSARPARFVAEIELGPDLPKMERELGTIVDNAWRVVGTRREGVEMARPN